MSFELRSLKKSDIPELVKFNQQAVSTWHHVNINSENLTLKQGKETSKDKLSLLELYHHGGPWNSEKTFNWYYSVLQQVPGEVFIAVEPNSGRIIGEIDFCWGRVFSTTNSIKRAGHVLWIYVDPEYREKGIGSALIEKVKDYLQQKLKQIEEIRTWPEDKRAELFFLSNGFTSVNHVNRMSLKLDKAIFEPLQYSSKKIDPQSISASQLKQWIPMAGLVQLQKYHEVFFRQQAALNRLLGWDHLPDSFNIRKNVYHIQYENLEALCTNRYALRCWINTVSVSLSKFLTCICLFYQQNGIKAITTLVLDEFLETFKAVGFTCKDIKPYLALKFASD